MSQSLTRGMYDNIKILCVCTLIYLFIGSLIIGQNPVLDSVRITLSQKKENLVSNVKQYLSALKWANTVSRKNLYQCSPKQLRKGK